MASIFISYRRDDSIDITGRIFDRVIGKFGKGVVFKDVDSLIGGQNFPEVLRQSIQRDTVVLVVIGRAWLGITQARADDPNDFARIEIETAIQRRATIIPVLIQGAQMPHRNQLPPSIAALANVHATVVRPDPDFSPDMNGVVRAIAPHMRSVGQRIARLILPVGVLVTLAVVAVLIFQMGNPDGLLHITTSCTQTNDGFLSIVTPQPGKEYSLIKTEGIAGQGIRIRGSGNAEAALGEVRTNFNQVNGTCISIDRGGGGWEITKPNEIGLTDFSLAYDKQSQAAGHDLVDHPIAILPFVVIVGKGVYDSGIHNLSREAIVGIFDKQYTNWSQLGGPDMPINAITRVDPNDDISGILWTFKKTIMRGIKINTSIPGADNSKAAIANVANAPYTISFTALPSLNFYRDYQDKVFPITIGGHSPTFENINTGAYEFWDIVHAYTYHTPDTHTTTGKAVQALLDAINDPAFQSGYFPSLQWYALPQPLSKQQQRDRACRNSVDVCSGI